MNTDGGLLHGPNRPVAQLRKVLVVHWRPLGGGFGGSRRPLPWYHGVSGVPLPIMPAASHNSDKCSLLEARPTDGEKISIPIYLRFKLKYGINILYRNEK